MINNGKMIRIWNKSRSHKAVATEKMEFPILAEGNFKVSVFVTSLFKDSFPHLGDRFRLAQSRSIATFDSPKIGDFVHPFKSGNWFPNFFHNATLFDYGTI